MSWSTWKRRKEWSRWKSGVAKAAEESANGAICGTDIFRHLVELTQLPWKEMRSLSVRAISVFSFARTKTTMPLLHRWYRFYTRSTLPNILGAVNFENPFLMPFFFLECYIKLGWVAKFGSLFRVCKTIKPMGNCGGIWICLLNLEIHKIGFCKIEFILQLQNAGPCDAWFNVWYSS